jgi:hypothetical protein
MDIAPRCSAYELQKALANADFHKLLDPESLAAVMGRGRSGSAGLRKAIKAHMPDGLWLDAMLIVELDGGANHSSPTQRRIDAERDMYYRSLGYLVLRYTFWQVKRQGAAVAAEIIATLAARSAEIGQRTALRSN